MRVVCRDFQRESWKSKTAYTDESFGDVDNVLEMLFDLL